MLRRVWGVNVVWIIPEVKLTQWLNAGIRQLQWTEGNIRRVWTFLTSTQISACSHVVSAHLLLQRLENQLLHQPQQAALTVYCLLTVGNTDAWWQIYWGACNLKGNKLLQNFSLSPELTSRTIKLTLNLCLSLQSYKVLHRIKSLDPSLSCRTWSDVDLLSRTWRDVFESVIRVKVGGGWNLSSRSRTWQWGMSWPLPHLSTLLLLAHGQNITVMKNKITVTQHKPTLKKKDTVLLILSNCTLLDDESNGIKPFCLLLVLVCTRTGESGPTGSDLELCWQKGVKSGQFICGAHLKPKWFTDGTMRWCDGWIRRLKWNNKKNKAEEKSRVLKWV